MWQNAYRASVPPAYQILTRTVLGLAAPLAQKLWDGLRRDAHPMARACVYGLARVGHAQNAQEALTQWASVNVPTRFIELVERLAEQHTLSRREVNIIEEAVLAQTTRAGYWK
jgi:hypothetical protein